VNVLSASYAQENGVPQVSVLNVTLFAVAINGMVNAIEPSVVTSCVDDIAISFVPGTLS
jgi:hypothetical protein